MQGPILSLGIVCIALLAATACALHLQFARRPNWYARTGFGMSLGVALIAIGAAVV
jgi:uncharacterized membrane protein YczE